MYCQKQDREEAFYFENEGFRIYYDLEHGQMSITEEGAYKRVEERLA